MNMFKQLAKICVALAAGFTWTGLTLAQSNSIEAFDVAQQGGNIVVRITTKEPLKAAPPSFTVANPARIVFDFAGTSNALGRNAQDVGQGELRSMNLVQGSDRTRLVLNLRRTVTHEVALDGKNIVVTLSSAGALAGAPTLSVQLCGPVHNHRHRLCLRLLDLCIDEKSLAVAAHVVDEHVHGRDPLPGSCLEECDRRASIEIGAAHDGRSHHLAVQRQVEQFSAVASPPRLLSAFGGDLPSAASLRK